MGNFFVVSDILLAPSFFLCASCFNCDVYFVLDCEVFWANALGKALQKCYALLSLFYLGVTCQLHFWQNNWHLVCATAVSWGWNTHQIKVSTEKITLKKKIHLSLNVVYIWMIFHADILTMNIAETGGLGWKPHDMDTWHQTGDTKIQPHCWMWQRLIRRNRQVTQEYDCIVTHDTGWSDIADRWS